MASDRAGLTTESDWFTIAFTPVAEATLLTRGTNENPLETSQISNASKKNTTIDLQSTLDLNAVNLADPAGDEVVVKLFVKQPQAELSLANSSQDDATFLKREAISEGTLFTIDIRKLSQESGKPTGSLEGLKLSVPENQIQVIPRGLSPAIKTGIPLQIWSETRVQGDSGGDFNVAKQIDQHCGYQSKTLDLFTHNLHS